MFFCIAALSFLPVVIEIKEGCLDLVVEWSFAWLLKALTGKIEFFTAQKQFTYYTEKVYLVKPPLPKHIHAHTHTHTHSSF